IRAPADFMMFGGGKRECPLFRTCPINQADVFMGVGNAMDVHESRCDECTSSCGSCRRALSNQFDFEPAFFLCLAQSRSFRILVQFDVATEGQPAVQPSMV